MTNDSQPTNFYIIILLNVFFIAREVITLKASIPKKSVLDDMIYP